MKRALVVFAVTGSVLLPTNLAWAGSVDDVANGLKNQKIFVDSDAEAKIDKPALERAIGNREVRIAVVPEQAGDPLSISRQLGPALGKKTTTVIVVAGNRMSAASNFFCQGVAAIAAGEASQSHLSDLADNNATSSIQDLINRLEKAPHNPNCQASSTGSGKASGAAAKTTETKAKSKQDSGSALGWILGILGIGAVGAGGFFVFRKRRRKQRELADLRTDVTQLYDRLGSDVQTLDTKDDPVARQALADASERYTATGALLATAKTTAELQAARRTAIEGLYGARTARTKLGLDPGPELPSLNGSQSDRLTERRDVHVGDQTYQGYPDYTPGAPHYYAGGGGYQSGWYSFPFWETMLVGTMLSGGLGGFGGGGSGFDSGFSHGYEAGREAAEKEDDRDDEDNSSDSGGSGDWAAVGDWSDAGDWGGGGGDWGGGDDGGGGDW